MQASHYYYTDSNIEKSRYVRNRSSVTKNNIATAHHLTTPML